MKLEEVMVKLFEFSRPTYFKKKREEVPALLLLENYFSKNELIEYLSTKQIKKLELIKNIDIKDLAKIVKEYEINRIDNIDLELLEEIDDMMGPVDNPNLDDADYERIYNQNHSVINDKLTNIEKEMANIKSLLNSKQNSNK